MFGSKTKRSEWGVEGFNLVSSAYAVFSEIDRLITAREAVDLSTISKFVPMLEAIHSKNLAYSSRWQDIVREDSKNGGSFTLLFGAVHAIEASAQAVWACYVIGASGKNNELSMKGLQVYRELAGNCFGNAKGLLSYDFKMSQTQGAGWFAQMYPIITSSELLGEIHTLAMTMPEIPIEWFPKL